MPMRRVFVNTANLQKWADRPNAGELIAACRLAIVMGVGAWLDMDHPAFAMLTGRAGVQAPAPGEAAEQPPGYAGPGTELKALLKWLRMAITPDCTCEAHARKMDREGPDWCEQHLDEIVGWLRKEAERRRLPFLTPIARRIVMTAIGRARRKSLTPGDKP